MQHAHRLRVRRGFTLVEILVVIAVIGILAALLTPALAVALRRTKTAAVAVELNDLAGALEAYKTKMNDYPPDFCDIQAFVQHMTSAFPRSQVNAAAWIASTTALPGSPSATQFVPANLDPAEALPFWLSMLSTNPRDPLSGVAPNYQGERSSFFTFLTERLMDIDGDGWVEYVPKNGNQRPFVYFDGRVVSGQYAYVNSSYPKQATIAPVTTEMVRPYRSNTAINATRDRARTKPNNSPSGNNNTEWLRPGAFQVISAGLDNEFGTDYSVSGSVVFKTFPTPNYPIAASSDDDNLASFSDAKTLGDAVP